MVSINYAFKEIISKIEVNEYVENDESDDRDD